MKRLSSIALSALLLFASVSFADEPGDRPAEQPAGSFDELRDRAVLRVGDKIFLTDADEDVIQGKIERLAWSDRTLTLEKAFINREGKLESRTFSETDIRRIEVEMSDSLANGALIGAAIGAGLMLVPVAIEGGDKDIIGGEGAVFAGAAIFAGAGAAIGMGVDAMLKKRRLIFDAAERQPALALHVVPILTQRRKGIAVSLSF